MSLATARMRGAVRLIAEAMTVAREEWSYRRFA